MTSRRVLDLGKAAAGHIEHTDFVGGAIAVFDRAQYAVRQGLVALKVQHRIHDMLHDFGACDGAILVDVAHDEGGNFQRFGYI